MTHTDVATAQQPDGAATAGTTRPIRPTSAPESTETENGRQAGTESLDIHARP